MNPNILPVLQAIAVMLSSTLYLVFVFVAAMITGNHAAWVALIIAAGIIYLFHSFQLMVPLTAQNIGLHRLFWLATVLAAALAGFFFFWCDLCAASWKVIVRRCSTVTVCFRDINTGCAWIAARPSPIKRIQRLP